jgi:hypothetical protein
MYFPPVTTPGRQEQEQRPQHDAHVSNANNEVVTPGTMRKSNTTCKSINATNEDALDDCRILDYEEDTVIRQDTVADNDDDVDENSDMDDAQIDHLTQAYCTQGDHKVYFQEDGFQ